MNIKKMLFFCLLFIVSSTIILAQTKQLSAFAPTRKEMLQRYKVAAERDSLVRKTAFKIGLTPNWGGPSSFWYRNILADSVMKYYLVDPVSNTKRPLFDAEKLSAALVMAGHKNVNSEKLSIKNAYLYPDQKKLAIAVDKFFYEVELSNYQLTIIDSLPVDKSQYPGLTRASSRWQRIRKMHLSPDQQWNVIVKEYNIYLEPVKGGATLQYTTDGTKEIPYGEVSWSPDSKYLIAYKIKRAIDKPVFYLMTSLPNTTRGEVKEHAYKQPGDAFTTYEMVVINVADKEIKKVQTDIIDFFDAPKLNWNTGDNDHFMFERVDRGHQRFRIIEVNISDGTTRNIIDERTNTFIYEQKIFTHYLPTTSEIIWVTEKDGWRHIYLVDAKKGVVKNSITKGEWVVRNVDSIDVAKREIWFQASGMNFGEDPYFIHYYRIGFDGKKMFTLTKPGFNHRIVWSPDKNYFVDTYSTVELSPVSILGRVADGKQLMELEQADISLHKAAGFKLPEPFVAKGRDGVTDIWGVICRPSDFDSTKSYPIIENIYAGPQDSFVPKLFATTSEMQSMAELGFIVVQIDGMGTYNRSKAFHDVCWKNIADAGFTDRILWMRALAVKYPQADTTRVGLFGTSAGGQNSLGGLLFHPNWYKAAVSSCGCHDNRVDKQWWNEQWMGYPVGKHYDDQSNITNAHKLKGKLLLVVGEADTNVPPESTYRVADALIKAQKSFEFLAIPGMGHSDGGAYGRTKKRDFFVKNLLGIDPPDRNLDELK
jgi:dipeptidyl aminopeptidase/acylaminoacyl peptidase